MTTAGDGDEPTIEDGSGSDNGVDWDAAAAAERAVPAPAAPAVPSSAASATPCFYPDAFHSAPMMPTLPSFEITGPSDSLPIATVVYTMGAGIPVQAYPCEKGAAAASPATSKRGRGGGRGGGRRGGRGRGRGRGGGRVAASETPSLNLLPRANNDTTSASASVSVQTALRATAAQHSASAAAQKVSHSPSDIRWLLSVDPAAHARADVRAFIMFDGRIVWQPSVHPITTVCQSKPKAQLCIPTHTRV